MLDRNSFDWIIEAEAKTGEALEVARQVLEDILDNFEDNYCAAYHCVIGEYPDVWPTRELVKDRLPNILLDSLMELSVRDEIIDAVVDELERDGCTEWVERHGAPAGVPLLRAHDHQWGKGHVHRLESDKTACGKKLENCPGDRAWGNEDDITCKACLRLVERR
jgi:hypothetical protein